MKNSLRLFYALWPDDEVRRRLALLLNDVQGRLVPPENLHITLAFLGQQPLARLPGLLAIAEECRLPAMTLTIDRWGYFRRHGVLWVGMSETPVELLAGRDRLAAILAQRSVDFDAGGRFKPHVTLARDTAAPPALELEPIEWKVNGRVELVSSTVVDRRVRYEVLGKAVDAV